MLAKLFVLLTALLAFAPSAKAQSAAEECPLYPIVPVVVTPRFDEPVLDFAGDIVTLQALARDVRHTVHGGHKGLTLGLTRYEPIIELRAPIKGSRFDDGMACAHVDHVDATIGYRNVTIYIPHEIPQGSCGFNEVMAHEQKHIDVNREILREYTPKIEDKLVSYLRMSGTFREPNPEYAMSILNEKMQSILEDVAKEIMNENKRRQQLVDSPEEYSRVSASCDGQLREVTTQFFRNRQ